MTSESAQGKALGKSLRETIDSANLVLKEIREGRGWPAGSSGTRTSRTRSTARSAPPWPP